jgi:DNA mismatch repair protein MutS
VIGDELCAGTESASALAIVGAGIAHLTRRGVPFIFATHLHELMTIPCVSSLRDEGLIQVMHLSVRCENKKCLVFDRRLTPGPGLPTYGLEVCKSLDLDPSFLATADAIRESLLQNKTVNKSTKSRYNARLIVNKCGVCGEAATETHHIIPQARKKINHLSNLVPLCEKCHHATHSEKLEINGYKQSSNGIILDAHFTTRSS